jgi:hypothetical protein
MRIFYSPLNTELNPIYLLALLGAHHIFHVSRIKVKYAKDTELKQAHSDKWQNEIAAVPMLPAVTKSGLNDRE